MQYKRWVVILLPGSIGLEKDIYGILRLCLADSYRYPKPSQKYKGVHIWVHSLHQNIKVEVSLLYCIKMEESHTSLPSPKTEQGLSETQREIKADQQIMLQPKKKSKSVFVISMALVLLMFIACFTTACQPTPEDIIVENKGDNLEDLLQNSQSAQIINIPDNWEETLSKDGNKLKVDIDATINYPQIDNYVSAKTEPTKFSQEQISRMVSVLMEGKEYYLQPPYKSKSELQTELIEVKADLQEEKKDPTMSEGSADDLQEVIALLEQAILDAPDTVDKVKGSSELYSDSNGDEYLNIEADFGKEVSALFTVSMSSSSKMVFVNFNNSENGGSYYEFNNYSNPNLAISKDQAIDKSLNLIDSLELTDFQVSAVTVGALEADNMSVNDNTPKCYIIYFTRTIGNMPTTYESNAEPNTNILYDSKDKKENLDYREEWPYECIKVCVDDSGVVEFRYDSPSVITDIYDNVELLPFNIIQEKFIQQIFIKYAIQESDPILKSKDIKITRIQLGLARIALKDNLNEYLLVPVWDFFGSCETVYKEDNKEEQIEKNIDTNNSFMTINAIDGTVIDRSIGY